MARKSLKLEQGDIFFNFKPLWLNQGGKLPLDTTANYVMC